MLIVLVHSYLYCCFFEKYDNYIGVVEMVQSFQLDFAFGFSLCVSRISFYLFSRASRGKT